MPRHSDMHTDRLIIFTRYPEPGRAKERLIEVLGDAGAAALSRRLAERLLERADTLSAQRPVAIEIRYDGADERAMEEWLGLDRTYVPQGAGELGERMARACTEAFADGAERVVVVVADCPALDRVHLERAFDALVLHDVVAGPAADGGYYLMGMRRFIPALFTDMPWGSSALYAETIKRLRGNEIAFVALEELAGVEQPADLAQLAWRPTEEHSDPERKRLSIIVPMLDESERIGALLASLPRLPDVEVIVVDGGSRDGTAAIAREQGVRVLLTERGRARQMNTGAAVSRGRLLLFLHADTRLPRGFVPRLLAAMNDRRVVGGSFTLRFDERTVALRCIEAFANLRARLLRSTAGEQAIFVRRRDFEKVGGFPDQPVGERAALLRRLRTRGRFAILPEAAITSSRRWFERGVMRTTLRDQAVRIALRLGLSPERLAAWHRDGEE